MKFKWVKKMPYQTDDGKDVYEITDGQGKIYVTLDDLRDMVKEVNFI